MWRILHVPTRTAWFAATTQQAQLEAITAAFGGSPVTARLFGADGTLRRTMTYPALTIDTVASPRRIVIGPYAADSAITTGSLGRWVLRTAGGVDIMEAPAAVSGGTINHAGGDVRTLCPPSISGVTVTADAGLPAAPAPIAPFQVTGDGIWTWFTRPEVIQIGDALYTGTVSSDGRCRAHRTDLLTQSTLTFDLSGVLEIDDHNNSSFVTLPDGRLAVFYGSHNDQQFKYRIWNPAAGVFSSVAAWSAQEMRGTGNGPYSYPNPIRFSQDSPRVWLFKRRWTDGGGGTRRLTYRTVTNLTSAPPHAWGPHVDVYGVPSRIPYWRTANDGVRRVHFAITNGHPVEGPTSLGHFYGELDGSNVMRWYRTNGTEITASLPFTFSDITQVYDGSAVRCWVSDCAIGSDGHPRILWMRYPNNNGTAIEYWHSRWTGSAWVNHKITDDGAGLYPAEQYYHGGLSFDGLTPTTVYLSAPIAGVRQVQEWRTPDNGATWAVQRVLTTGGTPGNPLRARPIGVRGGDGRINVLWWQGTYTSFVNYSTAVQAAG
jgi:hypothetical protein